MKYIIIIIMLCMANLSCSKKQDPVQRIIKIQNISGTVSLLKQKENEFRPAKKGEIISVFDTVNTEKASYCDLMFSDGSIIQLDENTKIQIAELRSDKSRSVFKTLFTAIKGALFCDMSKQKGSFEIHSSHTVAGIRGTRFMLSTDDKRTTVFTAEGEVYCFDIEKNNDIDRNIFLKIPEDKEYDAFCKKNNISQVTQNMEYSRNAAGDVSLTKKNVLNYRFRNKRLIDTIDANRKVHRSSTETIKDN